MRKALVFLAALATGCHVQTMDAQCPQAPLPADVAPLAAQPAPEPAPGGDPQAAPAVVQEQPEYVDVPAAPPGDAVASVDVFYSELAPYGTWSDDAEYGRVFTPASADYVPYSEGKWEYTAQGWTWISSEPFGWAVCHYGRWVHRNHWVWVPDTTWGPAWVEWRVSDGYIGWAPLAAPGLVATAYVTPVFAWRFVEPRAIFEGNLRSRYVPADRVGVIVRSSRPVKRYARTPQGGAYAAGPSPEYMRDHHHVTVQTVAARERDMGRLGVRERQDQDRRAEERRRAEVERWRVESQRRAEETAKRAAEERARQEAAERAKQEAARHAAEERARQEAAQRAAVEQQQRAVAAQQQAQADQQRRMAEQQRQQQLAQQQAQQAQADQQRRMAEQQRQQALAQQQAQAEAQRRVAAQQAAQQQAAQAQAEAQRRLAAQQAAQQQAAQQQAQRRVAQSQQQNQKQPQQQQNQKKR